MFIALSYKIAVYVTMLYELDLAKKHGFCCLLLRGI